MRDYPAIPNVFRVNSSSNVLDIDQQQNILKIPAAALQENGCTTFQHHTNANSHINNNINKHLLLNGDLANNYRGQTCHSNNSNHNSNINNCGNQPHHYNVKNPSSNGKNQKICIDDENLNRQSSTINQSISILDAITNAVTSGNCSGSIHPLNDDLTAPTTAATPATTATVDEKLPGPSTVLTNHEQQSFYPNYNSYEFQSVNYKTSYFLWIGTPVAAR